MAPPKPKDVTKATRTRLYGSSRSLNSDAKHELKLRIPVETYIQDPLVAKRSPMGGFNVDWVRWEPGLGDGPTSARFAVVDYNNDTGQVAPPAIWSDNEIVDASGDVKIGSFVQASEDGSVCWLLDKDNCESFQYHQLHVWAILQRALDFFEEGAGLGRPIPFGFEGNRLIVVPHAGYGANAYYDRTSKSLQFYYFDDSDGHRVYTCLSTDIINHEFGHAVLDGIRPHLMESVLTETGGFHEYVADFSAILLLLRNKNFRDSVVEETGEDLSKSERLANIAEEFGMAVQDKPFLRTAKNKYKMNQIRDHHGPHWVSQVLTGAMFDILLELADYYRVGRQDDEGERKPTTPRRAFWQACQRMQRMAIQPLDLLPPVDVEFRDYALAVLRAEEIANPMDPDGYRELMGKVFKRRGILTQEEIDPFLTPRQVFDRLQLDVYHNVDRLSRSRAAAYHFLDDNRERLFIPAHRDVIVTDLYDAQKFASKGLMVPRQIILEYIWREEVRLTGAEFGQYQGRTTTMLCGGTLVLDQNSNVLSWFRKPSPEGYGRELTSNSRMQAWEKEMEIGRKRQQKLLDVLAKRVASGHIGAALGGPRGLLGSRIPPVTVEENEGLLQFRLAPHMHLDGENQDHYDRGSRWEISS